MDKKIKILDKSFKTYIPHEEIEKAIDSIAAKINVDFGGCEDVPVLLCVLNGAIVFTAELMQRLEFNCELVSIKVKSYSGTQSTGLVRQTMGLTADVNGRRVIVVEDIIDSGNTIEWLEQELRAKGATDIKVCTLLFKPEAFRKSYKIDYVGMEIPNDFIVGFGLDYDEMGRNLSDIYVLDNEKSDS